MVTWTGRCGYNGVIKGMSELKAHCHNTHMQCLCTYFLGPAKAIWETEILRNAQP